MKTALHAATEALFRAARAARAGSELGRANLVLLASSVARAGTHERLKVAAARELARLGLEEILS